MAGWRSSSEQSPDRCPAAIQLRPAAGAQSFCLRPDCLMTCLRLRESRSSWSLFPGPCLQACATWPVWSSERLLRENGKEKIRRQQTAVYDSQQTRCESLRLITAEKPDVKECERRLLLSQSWPLDTGEGEVLDASDSLWVIVCFKPSSSSSREGQSRNGEWKSWATKNKTDVSCLTVDLWCSSSKTIPYLPLVVFTFTVFLCG